MKKVLALGVLFCSVAMTAERPLSAAEACSVAGPQSPRDITQAAGENSVHFDLAEDTSAMNLCNIHFHRSAEHRAPEYSLLTGEGDYKGWACSEPTATAADRDHRDGPGCQGVAAGDTIEVHWVFTSCDTGPGEGLGNCVSCPEEGRSLRVEGRVFVLAEEGADFADFDYVEGSSPSQPAALPAADRLVQYLGSTTGPSYDDETCSPYSVGWSVSPSCTPLAIDSLHEWCGSGNAFGEDHAHGVRELVEKPALLSAISSR